MKSMLKNMFLVILVVLVCSYTHGYASKKGQNIVKKDIVGVYQIKDTCSDRWPLYTYGVVGMEIKTNGDVCVYGGGFSGTECIFFENDGVMYIKVEKDGLLGEVDTLYVVDLEEKDGEKYLVLIDKDNEKIYWERSEQPKDTILNIDESGEITAVGDFILNYKLTCEDTYLDFGSAYRAFGSHLRIDEDGTGDYHIGLETKDFKLIQQDGKTHMMITYDPYSDDYEGTVYSVEYCEIEGKKYLVTKYHDKYYDKNCNYYWEPVDNEKIIIINGVYMHRI